MLEICEECKCKIGELFQVDFVHNHSAYIYNAPMNNNNEYVNKNMGAVRSRSRNSRKKYRLPENVERIKHSLKQLIIKIVTEW